MAWVPGTLVTNPAAGVVLADTGPLADGKQEFRLLLSCPSGTQVLLQRRDVANAVTLKEQLLEVALTLYDFVFHEGLLAGERIRVVNRNTLGVGNAPTGDVQVSIFYSRTRVPAQFAYERVDE